MKEFLPFHVKECLDCCVDVCSSYKYHSDIGLERLSYQSKIISINIRISREIETCPISEIAIIILSLKFISSFEAAAFSFTNLFFLPSRFSLLSCSHSLCCLPHLVPTAPTASRKKWAAKFSPLWAQYETLGFVIYTHTHKWTLQALIGSVIWEPSWLCVSRAEFVCEARKFFQHCFLQTIFFTRRGHFKELQVKGNLFYCSQIWTVANLTYKKIKSYLQIFYF